MTENPAGTGGEASGEKPATEPPSSPPPSTSAPPSRKDSDLRSAALVSVLTLLSRITGVIRDNLQARVFGSGWVADAFTLAFRIPNLFRMLFGEGALSASLVPIFMRMEEEGERERARRLLCGAFTVLAIFLSVLVLAGEGLCLVGSNALERVAAASAPAPAGQHAPWAVERLALRLLYWMLPYIPIVCLAALSISFLHARRRFAVPALTQTVFNVVMGGFLLFIVLSQKGGFLGIVPRAPEEWSGMLAGGILVGGLCQLYFQIPALRREGIALQPMIPGRDPAYREALRAMIPVVFGLSIFQINNIVDSLIALYIVKSEGAVAILYFGQRLFWLPLTLIGIAVATAVFPTLARQVARQNRAEISDAMSSALRVVLFLSVPAALGLILLREPLVRLFFEYGAFGADATERTGRVLLCFGLGLWATCALPVLSRCFYAFRDTKTPVKIGVVIVGLNFVLNLAFAPMFKEAGLALATSISTTVQVVVFIWILGSDKFNVRVSLGPSYFGKVLLATAGMAAACLALQAWGFPSPAVPARLSFWMRFAAVFVPLGVSVGVYFLVSTLLRIREAGRILALLHRPAPNEEDADA